MYKTKSAITVIYSQYNLLLKSANHDRQAWTIGANQIVNHVIGAKRSFRSEWLTEEYEIFVKM